MLGIHQALPTDASDLFSYAKKLGADTFQVFLRNNRNMRMRSWNHYEIENFNRACFASGIWSFVVHAPYAMNPATDDSEKHERYVKLIIQDLLLMQNLAGKKYYVLHPGSANTCSVEKALQNLKSVLAEVTPYCGTTTIAVEFMAGAGSQILSTEKQIQWCISNIPDVRFCFDTCHVFASGQDVMETLYKFSERVDVLHMNNSATAFGSRVDRHSMLQHGYISTKMLEDVYGEWVRMFPNKPIILETPEAGLLDDFRYLKGR